MFDLILRNSVEGFSISMMAFGFFFLIIPMQAPIEWIAKCTCFGDKKVEAKRDVSYDNFRYKFLTEYDRANPVTKRLGMLDYAKYMKGKI